MILGSRNSFLDSITRLSGALSTKLTTVEKLHVFFGTAWVSEDYTLWRRLYQHFPSVKALRTEGTDNIYHMGCTLRRDHGQGIDCLIDCTILPALEEIDLGKESLICRGQSHLATIQEFAFARQQAGRPVKVSFVPQ